MSSRGWGVSKLTNGLARTEAEQTGELGNTLASVREKDLERSV